MENLAKAMRGAHKVVYQQIEARPFCTFRPIPISTTAGVFHPPVWQTRTRICCIDCIAQLVKEISLKALSFIMGIVGCASYIFLFHQVRVPMFSIFKKMSICTNAQIDKEKFIKCEVRCLRHALLDFG